MARKKKIAEEERRAHTVRAKVIHLFGIEFHDSQLKAFTAFGRTPEEAAQSARNTIQRHLPRERWDVDIELINPETFAKAGVSLEQEH